MAPGNRAELPHNPIRQHHPYNKPPLADRLVSLSARGGLHCLIGLWGSSARWPGAIFLGYWLPYRLRSAPRTSFRELLPIPTGSLFTPRLWKV